MAAHQFFCSLRFQVPAYSACIRFCFHFLNHLNCNSEFTFTNSCYGNKGNCVCDIVLVSLKITTHVSFCNYVSLQAQVKRKQNALFKYEYGRKVETDWHKNRMGDERSRSFFHVMLFFEHMVEENAPQLLRQKWESMGKCCQLHFQTNIPLTLKDRQGFQIVFKKKVFLSQFRYTCTHFGLGCGPSGLSSH